MLPPSSGQLRRSGTEMSRGRKMQFRHSISNSDSEALKKRVVDIISPSLDSLLREIDGRSVETSGGTVTFNTANAQVEFVPMNWREKFLGTISDPNITYILMMVGVFGIMFELFNPGAILPGVVGRDFIDTRVLLFSDSSDKLCRTCIDTACNYSIHCRN